MNSPKFLAKVFLTLFILTCVGSLFAIKENHAIYNPLFRVLRIVFLGLFYAFSVSKYRVSFILSISLFLISSTIFSFDSSSIYGIMFLFFSRLALIAMVLEKTKIDRASFIKGFVAFFILGLVVLSYYFTNTLVFYVSSVATLALVILLALAFTNLLSYQTKFYKFLFIGIFLFAVSDALFGAQKILKTNYLNLVFSSILYNTGYFLICYSLVNKQLKAWK